MLRQLAPKPAANPPSTVPTALQPLLKAATEGLPLGPAMLRVIERFGFDSFMYGMSTTSYPSKDSRTYVWTTLPAKWVQLYDQNAYVEIDPRLSLARERVTPLIWDRHCVTRNPRAQAFLDHAAQYGIGNGVVIPIRDQLHRSVVVALNGTNREISPSRREEIEECLGTISLLATNFHEVFMAKVVDANLPPGHQGMPLSNREVQCLQLAAYGLTSGDIAQRLGLTERTIHFHFANTMSKLAAVNRVEAIAMAVGRQIITA